MRGGHRVVETTLMFLPLITLTAAMTLQHNLRPHTDNLSLESSIQIKSDIVNSIDSERFAHLETANTPLHLSTSDVLLQGILTQFKTAEVRLRRRRAAPKGCQFGTCQMHNLASTLYRMGQTNNKDQSKNAKDPNGYGR
ncbi:hypothetical protein Baya_0496 [Bagarius yarrelli]|uniref:ProAM N-terminal 20 peptide n=1 Tax=Bagarius yarrelli TaxID=175774 RepID=A0A556TIF3_BAGYA|nr:hypothetical protein Baya_0496 [Bagarius yarrelli]